MNLSMKAYNENNDFTIALDGPSASGKGLIGKMLAKEFNLVYIQSSIVYRGLAYICIQDNISMDNSSAIIELSKIEGIFSRIAGVDLNTEKIGEFASQLSIIPEVRTSLGYHLKTFIDTNHRILMEGRDIGTVIAPNADIKIFITANVLVRAKRRFNQLRLQGKKCILGDVLNLLESRDKRDSMRNVAPLAPASDALIVDTSDLAPAEVIQTIKDFINKQM